MYEVFGEFDSAEEINQAASGLKNEGDLKNILVMAKENGIDVEIAQAFVDGEITFIADTLMAAVGKIELERGGIDDPVYNGIKEDIFNYIISSCQDETLARAVRAKGKSLKKCIEHCKEGTGKILNKKAGSVPDRVVYGLVKEYYLS